MFKSINLNWRSSELRESGDRRWLTVGVVTSVGASDLLRFQGATPSELLHLYGVVLELITVPISIALSLRILRVALRDAQKKACAAPGAFGRTAAVRCDVAAPSIRCDVAAPAITENALPIT